MGQIPRSLPFLSSTKKIWVHGKRFRNFSPSCTKMLTNANKKEQKEQKKSSYQVIVRNSAVVETKPLQNAKMLTNANKKDKKEQDHFYCASCDFTSSRKGNYIKHLRTMKHLRNRGSRNINNECPLCARTYKHRSSLSRHRQICEAKNA